ncbi:MAG: glyoxalase [candidate division Zixibacteria bacterium RBG_16_50_21]|nr:MAG: glyoxalase [candidate division Zixibacteria bacterium RBG_16_50_21]
MSRIVHFEIQAENPERALKYYGDVFGWQAQKWDGPQPYWLITTGPNEKPGINGGLLMRQGPAPQENQAVNAFVCTVGVGNLDSAMASASKHGGTMVVPRMPIPGVGWLSYFKDTEGNIFGIYQDDPSAK